MITAEFYLNNGAFKGFSISGHEEHEGEYGMVCAAVSSCVMLVCNTVTEKLDKSAEAMVKENRITLRLSDGCDNAAELLVSAFCEHLEALSEEYGGISVIKTGIRIRNTNGG